MPKRLNEYSTLLGIAGAAFPDCAIRIPRLEVSIKRIQTAAIEGLVGNIDVLDLGSRAEFAECSSLELTDSLLGHPQRLADFL